MTVLYVSESKENRNYLLPDLRWVGGTTAAYISDIPRPERWPEGGG